MSKVLQLLDYQWHLNHDHIEWLEEQFYKQCKEESKTNESVKPEDKNGWDEEELEDDRDWSYDDIPF